MSGYEIHSDEVILTWIMNEQEKLVELSCDSTLKDQLNPKLFKNLLIIIIKVYTLTFVIYLSVNIPKNQNWL